jgi:hypothetical protein
MRKMHEARSCQTIHTFMYQIKANQYNKPIKQQEWGFLLTRAS